MCIGVSTPPPPQKHHPFFSAKPPPLNLQAVQFPPVYLFVVTPPKNRIFQWNTIVLSFSALDPSYFLKVTKFLVKISQFKFVVITEKHSVYNLFMVLNISDVSLFLCKTACNLSFKNSPPLKLRSCQGPPFWKFGWRLYQVKLSYPIVMVGQAETMYNHVKIWCEYFTKSFVLFVNK